MGNGLNAKVVIIGGGITGLSTAYHLKCDYRLLEGEKRLGGACRSETVDGFTLDYAEHFLRIPDDEVRSVYSQIMNGELVCQELNAAIFMAGREIDYPFQNNLYDLPARVKKDCLQGYVEAWLPGERGESSGDFESWIRRNLGDGIADHFMVPYNTKIWTIPPREMTADWFEAGEMLPQTNLEVIFEGAFLSPRDRLHTNPRKRFYPKVGGIEAVTRAFARHIKATTGCKVTSIKPDGKLVILEDGTKIPYSVLVSTIPLDQIVRLLPDLPAKVEEAAAELKHNSVHVVNLAVDRPDISRRHWLYFPEAEYKFARVYFPANFSIKSVPAGKSAVSAVFAISADEVVDSNLLEKATIDGLLKAGVIRSDDSVRVLSSMRVKYGFPLPSLGYHELVAKIQKYLAAADILSVGRYGNWEYSGIEHAITVGAATARAIEKTFTD